MSTRIKQLQARLARLKTAALIAPDPLTIRAFLTEFQQGVQSGESMGGSRQHESITRDTLAEAVHALKELVDRMAPLAAGREMAVSEGRLANKLSSVCSMLFYNSGVLRGIKNARNAQGMPVSASAVQARTAMQDANSTAVQAFLADYKKGLDQGVLYGQMPNNQGLAEDSGNQLLEAVETFKLVTRSMGQLAARRQLKINERAMAGELGRICTTLFYHCGVVQGMSKG